MKYQFSYYTESDFEELEELVLASYAWDKPAWGISRHEFSRGLHPAFCQLERVWERTVGIYRDGKKIVSCVINEANGDSNAFFLFDSQERAKEKELLQEMIHFARCHVSDAVPTEDHGGVVKKLALYIPKWNTVLRDLAVEAGFSLSNHQERVNILPFGDTPFEVKLPEGYSFADGKTTPDFYLSNTHMHAFHYGIDHVKQGEQAFHDLRQMKHYNPKLDVCILDPMKRPVGMAIVWCDERMPYCELEPLGVAWWERRKGLATALIHEVSNRAKALHPNCRGLLGGDQPFYYRIGFVTEEEIPVYEWSQTIYPSWDARSAQAD